MDERTVKAFEFAGETTKQLLALATGTLALTITFAKDVLGGVSTLGTWLLAISWVLYLLSLCAGIMTFQCMTGVLGAAPSPPPKPGETAGPVPSIYSPNIKVTAVAQGLLFLVATLLMVSFAMVGVLVPLKKDSTSAHCPCGKSTKP
jgi:hypothetical protein